MPTHTCTYTYLLWPHVHTHQGTLAQLPYIPSVTDADTVGDFTYYLSCLPIENSQLQINLVCYVLIIIDL